jgi:hypothetical protein
MALDKSQGSITVKNEYTVDEVRLELAKAIQEKIDAYSQKLVELRNRELSKAEEVKEEKGSHDNCPLCGKEDAPHACVCLHKAGWKKSAKAEEVEKCGDMTVEKKAPSEVEKCGDMTKEEIVPTVVKSAKKADAKHADIARKVNKGELMIDRKNENVPGKRLKDVPEGSQTGVLPSDKKSKVIEAEGSGGDITKGKGVKKSEETLEKSKLGNVGRALAFGATLATAGAVPASIMGANSEDAVKQHTARLQAQVNARREAAVPSAPAAKPKAKLPGTDKKYPFGDARDNPGPLNTPFGKGEVPSAKPPTAPATGSNPPAASNTSKPKNAAPKMSAAPKPPPAPGAPAMKGEEKPNKSEKGSAKTTETQFDTGKVRGTIAQTPGKKPAYFVDEVKKSEMGNCLLCGKNEHAGKC